MSTFEKRDRSGHLEANAAVEGVALSPVKRALVEIRALKERLRMLDEEAAQRNAPIAIVGMGMRFPGDVCDAESLWKLLAAGTDTITEIPADRWDWRQYFDADAEAPGAMYAVRGGFLADVDAFDAEFFGVAPREAAMLDPQQRLLHEVAWRAIEDAAIDPDLLRDSRTGIFIGLSNFDYVHGTFDNDLDVDAYSGSGSSPSMAAGRLAYTLGTHGPAVTLDTSCSSSLTAVHLAALSLRLNECDAAIVGGVNLILAPQMHIAFSKARMLAPDGRCKTFDTAADGYVRSEGCGVIVLKRLPDAERDGDRVLAVIRGSAVNHDGRSGGLTAPSSSAQAAVLREAHERAGVSINEVGMIEAHGTGTSLGDPIEMQALADVFKGRLKEAGALAVGSIKANIGHTEAASGMAGLMKAVLSIRHRAFPQQLHFENPSLFIPWADIPFYVPGGLSAWELTSGQSRRVAGVSSFGFSGSNAHVVIEEYVPLESTSECLSIGQESSTEEHLAVASALSNKALVQVCGNLAKSLEANPAWALRDVCGTLGQGRKHYPARRAWVVGSVKELREKLVASTQAQPAEDDSESSPQLPGVLGFLFTGQGSERPGMGLALYEQSAVFRGAVHRLESSLDGQLERSIASMWASERDELSLASFVQPALFAYGFALSELWRSWGVVPAVVLGHSLGEYVAATVAGVMSPEDAMRLVVARGRLTDELGEPGGMIAVGAREAAVRSLIAESGLGDEISIAAVNSPVSIVVSGRSAPIMQFEELLASRKMRSKRLRTTHGFHSAALERMLDAFEDEARKVEYRQPEKRWISNLTGETVRRGQGVDAAYWRRHLRETVEFSRSIGEAAKSGVGTFLEVGADPQLLSLAEANGISREQLTASIQRPAIVARRGSAENTQSVVGNGGAVDWRSLLTAAGRLYERGVDLNFKETLGAEPFQKVTLPGYPFQRTRHWFRAPSGSSKDHAQAMANASAQQALMVPIGLDIRSLSDQRRALDEWVSALMVSTLRDLGCWDTAGPMNSRWIVSRVDLVPSCLRLMDRWLQRLASEGILTASLNGDAVAYVVTPRIELPEIADAWVRVEGLLAGDRPLRNYLSHCAATLRRVLRGELDPLETLFPGGDTALATALYEESPGSIYANSIAAAAIGARVRAGSRTAMGFPRRTRILEIGAGTGATTSAVLRQVPAEQVIYTFSDISEVFLSRARERFKSHASYRAMEFAILDLDHKRSFAGHEGRYDVVIIANALHAAKDVSSSLSRVRKLIHPGGSLVLIETTRSEAWHEVSTSLIEGWLHFEDDRAESYSDSPLLPVDAWKKLLEQSGFEHITSAPSGDHALNQLGLHVLLAHVPVGSTRPSGGDSRDLQSTRMGTLTSLKPEFASLSAKVAEAAPERRLQIVTDAVRQAVAAVLGRTEKPGVRDRLMALGLDSLMAIELRNRLQKLFSLTELPATLIFDYPTCDEVAGFVMKLLGYEAGRREFQAESTRHNEMDQDLVQTPVHSDDEVDAMSREEVVELLRMQLRD